MIDQGFCFNVGEWNFPDAPLRGLYSRNCVYRGVIGMESFAPWIERLEKQMTERVLDGFQREIPPEWYSDDYDALSRLAEQLHRRRTRVQDLQADDSVSERKERCKRRRNLMRQPQEPGASHRRSNAHR